MKMERRTFRIGELAEYLGVECFVIRFWEKEFGIAAQRSEGGQRYYTDREMKQFALIKHLLYQKKFTIAGAKKHLEKSSHEQSFVAASVKEQKTYGDLRLKIKEFQERLKELRNLL